MLSICSTVISHTYLGQGLVQFPIRLVTENMNNLAKDCWQFTKATYQSDSISKTGKLLKVPVGFIGTSLVRLMQMISAVAMTPFVILGFVFSFLECPIRCVSAKYRQSLSSAKVSLKTSKRTPSQNANKIPQTKTSITTKNSPVFQQAPSAQPLQTEDADNTLPKQLSIFENFQTLLPEAANHPGLEEIDITSLTEPSSAESQVFHNTESQAHDTQSTQSQSSKKPEVFRFNNKTSDSSTVRPYVNIVNQHAGMPS